MINLFGHRKTAEKRIAELEDTIEDLQKECQEKDKRIEKLKAIIRGERVCDNYCRHCANNLESNVIYANGESYFTSNICKFDVKCKDFVLKE